MNAVAVLGQELFYPLLVQLLTDFVQVPHGVVEDDEHIGKIVQRLEHLAERRIDIAPERLIELPRLEAAADDASHGGDDEPTDDPKNDRPKDFEPQPDDVYVFELKKEKKA